MASQVTLCSILVNQGGEMKHVGEWRLSDDAAAQFAAAIRANKSEFSCDGGMSFTLELGHDDTFVLIARDEATLDALRADQLNFQAAL